MLFAIASQDEPERDQTGRGEKDGAPQRKSGGGNPNRMASEKQQKAVYARSRAKGVDEEALAEKCHGKKINELTSAEASKVLDWLATKEDQEVPND
jgi:hypothetical protein